MTDLRDQENATNRRNLSKRPEWVSKVRQQVGAVGSALALLVLFQRIFSLDLRGVVADLATVWTEVIGPVTGWILHWFVEVPLSLLGIHYRFPEAFRDYIAVGIIVCLSVTKAMAKAPHRGAPGKTSWKQLLWLLVGTVAIWIAWVMVWPVTLLSAALMSVPVVHRRLSGQLRPKLLREGEQLPPRSTGLMVLAPIAYLGVLLALNAVLR